MTTQSVKARVAALFASRHLVLGIGAVLAPTWPTLGSKAKASYKKSQKINNKQKARTARRTATTPLRPTAAARAAWSRPSVVAAADDVCGAGDGGRAVAGNVTSQTAANIAVNANVNGPEIGNGQAGFHGRRVRGLITVLREAHRLCAGIEKQAERGGWLDHPPRLRVQTRIDAIQPFYVLLTDLLHLIGLGGFR